MTIDTKSSRSNQDDFNRPGMQSSAMDISLREQRQRSTTPDTNFGPEAQPGKASQNALRHHRFLPRNPETDTTHEYQDAVFHEANHSKPVRGESELAQIDGRLNLAADTATLLNKRRKQRIKSGIVQDKSHHYKQLHYVQADGASTSNQPSYNTATERFRPAGGPGGGLSNLPQH